MAKKKRTIDPLRVLLLMDRDSVPPENCADLPEDEQHKYRAEIDVANHLRKLGHDVRPLGIYDDLTPLRDVIADFHPQITFNMTEAFRDIHLYDQHVVSHLELLGQSYTGCNPRGMTLARDKALTKKIMHYHRIRTPAFAVFPRGRKITRPKKLRFPLLVKSINVEGSIGIAQASVVHDDQKFEERVRFIHESLQTYAIAEEYIEGRELYVGVMGNLRLTTLPAWELRFDKVPEDAPRIASRKVKFDVAYQKKWGITSGRAEGLPEGTDRALSKLCRRIYRILGLTGYARLDFRMSPSGELYLLEANPNPHIGRSEEFAESAEAGGMKYEHLLQEIIRLGLNYHPEILS
jgi:D-alanine-D-alanine ligase